MPTNRKRDAAVAAHSTWEASGARDRGGRVATGRAGKHTDRKREASRKACRTWRDDR